MTYDFSKLKKSLAGVEEWIKKEFANIDEFKIVKLALIHDIVEIHALESGKITQF